MQPASVKQAHFPERVGKYELILPIGTGGMATVYLARTQAAGGGERDVALKLVHAHLRADEESKLHLLEEAKLAALIRHPNVIRVLEVGEDPIGVFLVMEYIDGETLSGLIRLSKAMGRPMSRRLMARVLNDALLGLHAAHELRDAGGKPLNLVHRDFSPQNILVSVHGQTRLGDFGVAKAADRAVRTKTGLTKGKIAYMSPEQARGHGVDRRCDVWAAGVVAWELLAGERIHKSEDDVATLLSIVTERPPRLSSVLDDLPEGLDDAIAQALEPALDRRCATAEDFRQTLDAIWNAGDGIADALELGKFVREVSSEQRAKRRRLVDEIRAARRTEGSRPSPSSSRPSSSRPSSSRPSSSRPSSSRPSSSRPSSSRPSSSRPSGSRPSSSLAAAPRGRLSSGPVLVTDVDGTSAPSSADHPHPFSDGDSDPLATRQDLPSAPPSAMTSDPNHEAPSSALGPAASIGPNAEEHDEEDLALAATNAAVLAPTTDPGAPQSSVQPSEATLRAAHVDSADSMHAGSMHTGSMHTEPQRAGLVWDEEAHYEAETRVIPDAERQLRNAGLLRDDLTETSAVVPAWEQPRRRSRWALLMAAVLGAAGSTVVAWLLRSPPPEPAAATSTVEEAANEPSLSEPNSDSEQSEELKASTADELELAPKPSSEATPEPASAASSTPPEIRATSSKRHSAKKHPAKARPTPPPKQSPRPVRDKPKLATSPYGEPKSGQ